MLTVPGTQYFQPVSLQTSREFWTFSFQTRPVRCPSQSDIFYSFSFLVLYPFCYKSFLSKERERWWRNRTGRPLSPSQIPQKNISTPSKLHKTTSVGWQRTSGNQKSRPLSSKTGRKKYKRRERKQRRCGGSSVPGREARPGKGI